ncbi:succinate dehydrogenase, hydrophobic membrane anchor protein [Gammaproteobacteria bacterium]|nr:succinate dehydrogenase, hydrophobic membrane anchor protein [Gammaproteobacteria bacterium]
MKGSIIWFVQRYSSLAILAYFLHIVFYLVGASGSYYDWVSFIASIEMKVITSLISILIISHAFIGLWTVGTDYLTKRTLGFLSPALSKKAESIQFLYQLVFILCGLLYLGSILYIIWNI